jgi:hypothetical protein
METREGSGELQSAPMPFTSSFRSTSWCGIDRLLPISEDGVTIPTWYTLLPERQRLEVEAALRFSPSLEVKRDHLKRLNLRKVYIPYVGLIITLTIKIPRRYPEPGYSMQVELQAPVEVSPAHLRELHVKTNEIAQTAAAAGVPPVKLIVEHVENNLDELISAFKIKPELSRLQQQSQKKADAPPKGSSVSAPHSVVCCISCTMAADNFKIPRSFQLLCEGSCSACGEESALLHPTCRSSIAKGNLMHNCSFCGVATSLLFAFPGCSCVICTPCWQQVSKCALDEKALALSSSNPFAIGVECPKHKGTGSVLADPALWKVLSAINYRRFALQALQVRLKTAPDSGIVHCPHPKCIGYPVVPAETKGLMLCPFCAEVSCLGCKQPPEGCACESEVATTVHPIFKDLLGIRKSKAKQLGMMTLADTNPNGPTPVKRSYYGPTGMVLLQVRDAKFPAKVHMDERWSSDVVNTLMWETCFTNLPQHQDCVPDFLVFLDGRLLDPNLELSQQGGYHGCILLAVEAFNDSKEGSKGREVKSVRRRTRMNPSGALTEKEAPSAEELRRRADRAKENGADLLNILADSKETKAQTLVFAGKPFTLPAHVTLSFEPFRHLRHLDLSGCRLKEIPPLGTMALEKCYLMNNHLEEFPSPILTPQIAASLRILDLSFNKIKSIPRKFESFTKLQILEIGHNQLKTICSFQNLVPTLEVFDVTDNNLSGIPSQLGGCKKLWRLKLMGNPIHQIPPDVYLRGVDAVKQFLLEFDPKNLDVPQSTFVKDMLRFWEDDAGKEVSLRCALKDEETSSGVDPASTDPGSQRSRRLKATHCTVMIHMISLLARAPTVVQLLLGTRTGVEAQSSVASNFHFIDRYPLGSDGPQYLIDLPIEVSNYKVLEALAKFICTGDVEVAKPYLEELILIASTLHLSEILPTLYAMARNELIAADDIVADAYARAYEYSTLALLSAGGPLGKEPIVAPPIAIPKSKAPQPSQIPPPTADKASTTAEAAGDPASSPPPSAGEVKAEVPLAIYALANPDTLFLVGPDEVPFRAHKDFICARNVWFHGTLKLGFIESSLDAIRIPDVDPQVFEALLTFLYSDSHGKKMTPQNAVDLLFVTEEYQCLRLQAMAESAVGYHLEIENAAQILQISYFLDLHRLKKAAMYFIGDHYRAVRKTEGWPCLEDRCVEELHQRMSEWSMTIPK